MEAHAHRFPMDYDAIQPGDVIPCEYIEARFGVRRGTDDFNIALLNLRSEIMRELKKRNRFRLVRRRGHDLHVLTAAEQVDAAMDGAESGRRCVARYFAYQMMTPTEELTDDEREKHERNMELTSRRLAAMTAESRKFFAEERRKETPSLRSSYEQPKLAGGTEKPEDSTRNQDESS